MERSGTGGSPWRRRCFRCRWAIAELICPSEAEVFWSDFLKDLLRRGLTGVKLVISDAHEGLKDRAQAVPSPATKAMPAAWPKRRISLKITARRIVAIVACRLQKMRRAR